MRASGLTVEVFEHVFNAFTAQKVIAASDLATVLDLSREVARRCTQLLVQFEDVYPSLATDQRGRPHLYYCYAPQTLVTLCRRRKVSIAKFLQLSSVMDEFMTQVEDYYMNRSHADGVSRAAISKMKREMANRIQPLIAPEGKPLKARYFPISTSHIWRYVRTAQDLVTLKLDVPRPYLDALKDALLSARDASSQEVTIVPTKNGPKLLTITCKWREDGKTCGKERKIKPQDAFQVKYCAEHQKANRLAMARERRKSKRKTAPKKAPAAKKTKPARPRKPKAEPTPEPASEPVPAPAPELAPLN